MHCQADGTPSVHLGCLPLQLWDLDLRSSGRICGWNFKFKLELVLLQVMHVPALAIPLDAIFATFDGEPV